MGSAAGFDSAERERARLRDRVIELASNIHAAESELAGLIAELDGTDAWHGPGYVSLAHWLGVNAAFTPSEAQRRVRIAARRAELPALTAAADGVQISSGLMDRVGRVASGANDADLADLCTLATPSQALRTIAAYRRVEDGNDPDPEPDSSDVERTWLRKWWDDANRLHLDGCLNAIDGARFETALDAACAAGERDADDAGVRISGPEALTRLSELMLDDARATGLTRDGTNFAVELALDAGTGICRYGSIHLTEAEAGEVACDCRLHHLIHDGGIALNLGRDVRTASRTLRRALRLRDGGCAFPGCGQTRFVHAHHIVFWENGGPTDLDNMVLLCGRHHRLLHQGGYTCEMGPDSRPRFLDPTGGSVVPIDGKEPPVVSSLLAWHERQRRQPVDPRAARPRSGGEPLTTWALDNLVAHLCTAAA